MFSYPALLPIRMAAPFANPTGIINVRSPMLLMIVCAPVAAGLTYVAIKVKISKDHHPQTPIDIAAILFLTRGLRLVIVSQEKRKTS